MKVERGFAFSTLAFGALGFVQASAGSRIKHVVVLFEENRSFDHLLGWSKNLLGVDGLTGLESNPVDLGDKTRGNVSVSSGATYVNTIDPNHGYDCFTSNLDDCFHTTHGTCPPQRFPAYDFKVFGGESEDVARMNGFFGYELKHHSFNDSKFVMEGFAPAKLPITVGLAKEFAVFDKFYAAFPGPSWPNRKSCNHRLQSQEMLRLRVLSNCMRSCPCSVTPARIRHVLYVGDERGVHRDRPLLRMRRHSKAVSAKDNI